MQRCVHLSSDRPATLREGRGSYRRKKRSDVEMLRVILPKAADSTIWQMCDNRKRIRQWNGRYFERFVQWWVVHSLLSLGGAPEDYSSRREPQGSCAAR